MVEYWLFYEATGTSTYFVPVVDRLIASSTALTLGRRFSASIAVRVVLQHAGVPKVNER